MRKGGVIHGPRPRDMSTKLNRRVRELALRSALSAKWLQGDLIVVKNLDWIPPPSTNLLRRMLQAKGWGDAIFLTAPRHPAPSIPPMSKVNPKPSARDPIYTEEQQQEHKENIRNFIIASNNAVRVEVIRLDTLKSDAQESARTPAAKKIPGELHAYHILKRKRLICDIGAIEWLEEKLGGSIFHDEELVEIAKDLQEIQEEGLKEDPERLVVADDILAEADRVLGTVNGQSQMAKTDATGV
jgi:large subunit ribosomal protein L4